MSDTIGDDRAAEILNPLPPGTFLDFQDTLAKLTRDGNGRVVKLGDLHREYKKFGEGSNMSFDVFRKLVGVQLRCEPDTLSVRSSIFILLEAPHIEIA